MTNSTSPPIDQEAVAQANEILGTVKSVRDAKTSQAPGDVFNREIENLVKRLQAQKWKPRRIKRYIKENFDIDVVFKL